MFAPKASKQNFIEKEAGTRYNSIKRVPAFRVFRAERGLEKGSGFMEQMEEIQIPEIEERKQWGGTRRRKIAAGILTGCVIVFLAGIFAFVKWYYSEENVFLRACRNLTGEVLERQKLWEDATGKGPGDELDRIKLTTVCNLSGDGLPMTLGVDTVLERDADARKMKACTKFSVSNSKLAELDVYGEDKELIVTLPDFFEKNFVFDAERIDIQYNNSLFANLFGTLKDCEISIDLFPEGKPVSWAEYLEGWKDNIQIEKLDKAAAITVPERDDRQYRCSQYRLTISADWLNQLAEDYLEAEGGFPEEEGITVGIVRDIAVVVAIEEKNDRIVRISLEEPFVVSVEGEADGITVKTSGSICFLGEGRSIDDIFVSLQTEVPLTALGLDERLLAAFGNRSGTEDNMVMDLRTETLYDENDMCVTSKLHGLTISVDRIGSFKLTGEMELEPLRESVEAPVGESIRLFEITEEEYRDLRDQIMKKIWRWLKALSIFG